MFIALVSTIFGSVTWLINVCIITMSYLFSLEILFAMASICSKFKTLSKLSFFAFFDHTLIIQHLGLIPYIASKIFIFYKIPSNYSCATT